MTDNPTGGQPDMTNPTAATKPATKPKPRSHHRSPKNDVWYKTYWRPSMAWSYLVICLFDFIGGPILNALVSFYTHSAMHDWNPLTLRGGGLYHMAMAAIVGLATWTRGIEKQVDMNNNNTADK